MPRYRSYIETDTHNVKTSEWLTAIRNTVSPRDNLQLKSDRCALLVIDMLNYFCRTDGRAFLPVSPIIGSNIYRILTHWRSIGGMIIFTRHCHKPEEDLGMLGKFWSDYISCEEEQSQIISLLTPQVNELVLTKNTYDAFYNTTLEEVLLKAGISQVLITGVMTNLCCETTARAAFCRNFEVYFTADATGTATEPLHFNSLLSVATGFGVVLSTSEVVNENL